MTPAVRVALAPPRRPRSRWWWAVLLVSLLLHGGVLALILYRRVASLPDLTAQDAHQSVVSDDVAMVFETKQKTPPSQKSEDTRNMAVAETTAAPPPPAPSAPPKPTPASPPDVSLNAEPPADAPVSAPDLTVPNATLPVPPVPPVPSTAPPRPPARSVERPVPRPPTRSFAQPSLNGFPAPQNFSFGSNPNAVSGRGNGALASERPLGGASPRAAGGRDFLLDASLVSGADPGKDWFAELLKWWLAHRYYPEQAVKALEQGDPGIRVTVERDGRVRSVELYTRSGSMWLDMGAQGTFRDAHLPPFPPQTQGQESVIALNIHYYLVFQ